MCRSWCGGSATAARMVEPVRQDGVVDAAPYPVGSDPGAGDDEQVVDGPAVAGVGEGTLSTADGHPGIEHGEGLGIEGDDPLGVEFAEWHF